MTSRSGSRSCASSVRQRVVLEAQTALPRVWQSGTVHQYLERAVAAGIGWPLPEGWGEEELEAKLFGNQPERARAVQQRPQPDWKAIHEQLQQNPHLTLQLLWGEFRQANPEGYRYSWFCERYQHWRRHLDVVLRQEHKAGEKMFVDWAGGHDSRLRRHERRGLARLVVC